MSSRVKVASKKRSERADRAGRVVVLGLAEQQGRAAFDVAQVDVVAERGADDPAVGGDDEHDLGFRVVPRGGGMDAGIHAGADGGHRLGLGEDFGVRADADLEILAPGALLDQHFLQALASAEPGFSLLRSSPTRRVTSSRIATGGVHVAAGALLDDAFQHRDGEGDAGGLDRLQVDRGEQPGACAVAGSGGVLASMASSGPSGSPAAARKRGGWIGGFAEIAHGRDRRPRYRRRHRHGSRRRKVRRHRAARRARQGSPVWHRRARRIAGR